MELAHRLTRHPFQRIQHIPGQPVSYLKNPKVGCTSIELTLWRRHDPDTVPRIPHRHPQRPFVRSILELSEGAQSGFLESKFFTVVRNPFARVLSAYLDKVGPGKNPWKRISLTIGFEPDSDPTLDELLGALLDRDPVDVDKHFQPQWMNTLHGFAPLDYLGYLERMHEVSDFLRSHGFSLERSRVNATNASSRIGLDIAGSTAELIRRYYAEDFRLYGYSVDPHILEPVEKPAVLNKSRDKLWAVISNQAANPNARGQRPARTAGTYEAVKRAAR